MSRCMLSQAVSAAVQGNVDMLALEPAVGALVQAMRSADEAAVVPGWLQACEQILLFLCCCRGDSHKINFS